MRMRTKRFRYPGDLVMLYTCIAVQNEMKKYNTRSHDEGELSVCHDRRTHDLCGRARFHGARVEREQLLKGCATVMEHVWRADPMVSRISSRITAGSQANATPTSRSSW